MQRKLKVLFDNDAAVDDFIALAYLCSHPQVDLVAVTTSGTGEAHALAGASNTADVCELFGRGRIPIAYGSEAPCGDHGKPFPDFLRTAVDKLLEGKSVPKNPMPNISNSAVELMKSVVESSNEKITILATGPLTNVAQFIQTYPTLKDKIERIVIMGGAVNVEGNIRALVPDSDNKAAEWNIYADPDAADVVMRSSIPVTLVPLDATNQVPMTRKFYDDLSKATEPGAQFVFKLIDAVRKRFNEDVFFNHYYLWDPLASMLLVSPELGITTRMALKMDLKTAETACVSESTQGAALIDVVTKIPEAHLILDKLVEQIEMHMLSMQQKTLVQLPSTILTNLFQPKEADVDDASTRSLAKMTAGKGT